MQASVTVEPGEFAPPPVAEPEDAPRRVRRPAGRELDAAASLLLDEERMSVRNAGVLLGLAHSNVGARAKRHAAADHTRHTRRELRRWAQGFVAGRRSALDERVQTAPESWEDRLARLTPDSAAEWQQVHVMPYDSATSSVSKLRLSRHGIERGGSWQFRVERAEEYTPFSGAQEQYMNIKPVPQRMGRVMAMWRGTACTNCGAVTEDPKTCPLCGYDKTTPDGDDDGDV